MDVDEYTENYFSSFFYFVMERKKKKFAVKNHQLQTMNSTNARYTNNMYWLQRKQVAYSGAALPIFVASSLCCCCFCCVQMLIQINWFPTSYKTIRQNLINSHFKIHHHHHHRCPWTTMPKLNQSINKSERRNTKLSELIDCIIRHFFCWTKLVRYLLILCFCVASCCESSWECLFVCLTMACFCINSSKEEKSYCYSFQMQSWIQLKPIQKFDQDDCLYDQKCRHNSALCV